LDRFPIRVEDGQVLVDTGTIIEGPPEGVVADPHSADGPACSGVFPPLPTPPASPVSSEESGGGEDR
jgi:hypothetical protein